MGSDTGSERGGGVGGAGSERVCAGRWSCRGAAAPSQACFNIRGNFNQLSRSCIINEPLPSLLHRLFTQCVTCKSYIRSRFINVRFEFDFNFRYKSSLSGQIYHRIFHCCYICVRQVSPCGPNCTSPLHSPVKQMRGISLELLHD